MSWLPSHDRLRGTRTAAFLSLLETDRKQIGLLRVRAGNPNTTSTSSSEMRHLDLFTS